MARKPKQVHIPRTFIHPRTGAEWEIKFKRKVTHPYVNEDSYAGMCTIEDREIQLQRGLKGFNLNYITLHELWHSLNDKDLGRGPRGKTGHRIRRSLDSICKDFADILTILGIELIP